MAALAAAEEGPSLATVSTSLAVAATAGKEGGEELVAKRALKQKFQVGVGRGGCVGGGDAGAVADRSEWGRLGPTFRSYCLTCPEPPPP